MATKFKTEHLAVGALAFVALLILIFLGVPEPPSTITTTGNVVKLSYALPSCPCRQAALYIDVNGEFKQVSMETNVQNGINHFLLSGIPSGQYSWNVEIVDSNGVQSFLFRKNRVLDLKHI